MGERRAKTHLSHAFGPSTRATLENSEAYAKTRVGVGSLLRSRGVDGAGSTARAAARALGSQRASPRASGDARTRPVLSKNCQEAALAGSGTAAPRGAAANRADRAQAQAQGSYVAGSPVLEHHGHRQEDGPDS